MDQKKLWMIINMNLEQIQTMVRKKQGARDELLKQQKQLKEKQVILNQRSTNSREARALIQAVAQKTQENLEFHISNFVTMALTAILDNAPTFVVRMVQRRNTVECDLFFEQNGTETEVMEFSGGGVKDIASFALRIAYWVLKKNRAVFLLDEPFKNVSANYMEKTGEMVRRTADKLGLQIIMTTHVEELIDTADLVYVGKLDKNDNIILKERK